VSKEHNGHTLRMIDRRQHARFVTEPMYTPIAARLLESEVFDIEGHAYDISEGGLRFELDRPIAPGTKIAMQITLPSFHADIGPGRSIFVFANVVWIEDDDEPGPVRMAAVFTHFARAGDRERLLRQFATGRYRAAA
jgi:PilZ domain